MTEATQTLVSPVGSVLEAIAPIGSSLDLCRTADQVLGSLRRVVGFDSASVFVLDRTSGAVVCRRSREAPGEAKRPKPSIGQGPVGLALESGRAALYSIVDEPNRSRDLRPATGSALVGPLIGGEGRLIGALLVESNAPGHYGEEALDVLMTFGRVAAPPIERALMYSKLVEERRLEGEMEVARQVMGGLLPSEAPRLTGFDTAAVIEPCYEVGGDYYDFIALGDDRWAIAMADVSGKGVAAALVVAAMRSALYTLAKREIALRGVLRHANEFIHASTGSKAKYVTLFYAVLDIPARRLIYINAGHLPPVVMRGDGDVELLRSGGFPLGFFDNPRYFEQFLQLKTGDMLCLYTDGITEATNAADEDYSRARLIEVLRKHRDGSAEELCGAVLADVRRFSERAPTDDASILIIKAT